MFFEYDVFPTDAPFLENRTYSLEKFCFLKNSTSLFD